MMRLETATALE